MTQTPCHLRPGSLLPFGALNLTPVRTRRSQAPPAARYTHPKALEAPAANGAHDHGLDVLAENAPNYLRWIADMIEPYLGHNVLDLGAGIGAVTTHYVPGRKVVACDRSSTCVAAMQRRFANAPNVTVIEGDLTELSDLGARFDSAVMLNVLEHIEDDVGVLSSLREFLQPAGRIIVYVPALNVLYGKMDRQSRPLPALLEVALQGDRSRRRAGHRDVALHECVGDPGLAGVFPVEYGPDLWPQPGDLGPHRRAVEPSDRGAGSSPRRAQPSRGADQPALKTSVAVSRAGIGEVTESVRAVGTRTDSASSAFRVAEGLDVARRWLQPTRHQAIAAFVLYLAVGIGYFGVHVLPHLSQACVCEPGPSDSSIFMWGLAWWPHALLHGMNPFFTNALFAPDHLALGGDVTMPLAALVTAPITLLFGPVVSYNLLMLASPVLAAFFAFLLCRYITRNFAASLFGGYIFGFSAYMLGQLLGHLHLVLVFPIPAAVHLTLRAIDGRIGQRRFVILLALCLLTLILTSTEIALTFVILGAVTLAVAFTLAPADRPRLLRLVKPIVGAGVLAAIVTSPFLYYGLKGVPPLSPLVGDIYGGDALGFLVPTMLIRLGRSYFLTISATFSGADVSEAGTYLGLPLALIVARYLITRWRLTSTKIMTITLAVVVILLLGAHLYIAGHPTVPLPWKLLNHSVLRDVLPVRLALYMFLIVAIIAAMWLAQKTKRNWAIAKWVVAAVSIAFLVPNTGSGQWHWDVPNPAFFATREYRTYIKRGETVLVLPWGYNGMSMLWQAETGMWFRMTEGYLTPSLRQTMSPTRCYRCLPAGSSRFPWALRISSLAGTWGPWSWILPTRGSGRRRSRQ